MTNMQILVPLDGSELAESALAVARSIARATDGTLNLVGVSTRHQPAWTRDVYAYLQSIAEVERQSGFRVQTTVRVGDPGEAVLALQRELDANLIVMATHGRSGIGRALLGSVADQITRASSVPVVVVRPEDRVVERLHTILVAVDGTPGAAAALATAVPLAHDSGARVVVVHALSDVRTSGGSGYVEGLAASLRRANVPAEARAIGGAPSGVVVSVADEVDADLIVMSTRARRGAARSVLGSVADEVVRRSRRPVLLVRRDLPQAKRKDVSLKGTSTPKETSVPVPLGH